VTALATGVLNRLLVPTVRR